MQDKNADTKPVLRGKLASVHFPAVLGDKEGMLMYPLQLSSGRDQDKLLYSPDEAAIGAWGCALQLSVAAQPQYISSVLALDWSATPIGAGLFATVHNAEDQATKTPVALKVIKSSAFSDYADVVEREACVWSAAGTHPHIAGIHMIFRTPKRFLFVTGEQASSTASTRGFLLRLES